MRVLVVDDEAPARRRLRRMLEESHDIEEVGEADSSREALALVDRMKPDLLLLDIHMPGLDGLELAAAHAHLPPVVFVTAHDEHAVRAFEVNAVDFLLKPVRPERLAAALARVRARGRVAAPGSPALPREGEREVPRVVSHERGTIRLFDARSINRFWASEKYTLFCAEGREHLIEEPLSVLALRLARWGFLRIHRGELIRVAAVRTFSFAEGIHEVRLEDGQVSRVSRRLVGPLKKHLGL